MRKNSNLIYQNQVKSNYCTVALVSNTTYIVVTTVSIVHATVFTVNTRATL